MEEKFYGENSVIGAKIWNRKYVLGFPFHDICIIAYFP